MGNPSGGQSQGFTYAGTLQASIIWDLHKLLGFPAFRSTLAEHGPRARTFRPIISEISFTVQSAYTAPGNGTNNLTLGEMYLQQQLFEQLTRDCGRTPGASASTFATMPVLNNYLNAAINPAPGALGINDATFASYPPAWNGVLKRFTTLPRRFRWRPACSTRTKVPLWAVRAASTSPSTRQPGRSIVAQLNYLFNHAPG